MSNSLEEFVKYEPSTPDEIIQSALKQGYDRFYCMYSGGQDSTCTTHYIAENYPANFAGVVHADTGVSLEATRKFVVEYCREWDWPLYFTKPPKRTKNIERHGKDFTYRSFVLQYGFPHARNHPWVLGYLKKLGWEGWMRDTQKLEAGACFISGVRKRESMARSRFREYTKKEVHRDKHVTYVSPFLYKTGDWVSKYFFNPCSKKSPAYAMGFGISGECMCGAFADPWERELLRQHDPKLYAMIVGLERDVKVCGSEDAKHHTEWGKSEPYMGPALGRVKKDKWQETLLCGESCNVGAQDEE